MMLNQMPAPIASVVGGGNFVELEQTTHVETAHAYMFMPDGETVESISQKYRKWRTVIVISFGGSTAALKFKLPDGWLTGDAYSIYQHDISSNTMIGSGSIGLDTFKVQPLNNGQRDDFCIVNGNKWQDGTIELQV